MLGCGDQGKTLTLHLRAHTLPDRPPIANALDGSGSSAAHLELAPLGDFGATAALSPPLRGANSTELDLPQATRALDAAVIDDLGKPFIGYVERQASPDLSLLLWPRAEACALDAGPGSLALRSEGAALGYSPKTRVLLIAGGGVPSAAAESVALRTFDSGTGEYKLLSAARPGDEPSALSEPRAFASVTPFGDKLLIAGGENPLRGESAALAPASGTAEIFDPGSGRIDARRITLSVERSRHTAIALGSGETLLVGGRGPRGTALNALEVVSPRTQSASLASLPSLDAARLFPVVLRLDDQRLFIAGGTSADGTPLAALEWLSADARTHLLTRLPENLPARHDRAFAALPGGGVLAVGGCAPSEVSCESACRIGCPPIDPDSASAEVRYDAFWIAPDGTATELEFPIEAPRPVLLGGADGAPLLSTGDPTNPTIYRFNPWRARFEPADLVAPLPPRAALGGESLDAQAFAWLAEDASGARLIGARWGTREHFASDDVLLSGSPPERELPFPLVPDRMASEHVRYLADSRILAFDGDSTPAVYVAGADYADVAIDLWVEGHAPRVVLGSLEFGENSCPWPPGAATTFRVERVADKVILSSGERRAAPCPGPAGRVRFGLRRGDDDMVVRGIGIERRPN
jgi:hypothetical protein